MLQPFDVIINRPFKAHIRRSYNEWAQKTNEMRLTGRSKSAMLTVMCQWTLEAWRSISQDTIAKSFKVTGICNKMDRNEDDFPWHQSDEESCQEDATDNEED
jgi:hypothetical protein